PAPRAGELLIEIHAASINAADWKMRSGHYGAAVSFPHIPGRDFSGVVVSSGAHFQPGEAVFGVCEVPREGAYAEKIAIREAIVARKPERLTHVQTAAIALTGLAALVTQGAVPLPAITEYPLAKAAEAHRVSEGRHLRGKLVLRVQGTK